MLHALHLLHLLPRNVLKAASGRGQPRRTTFLHLPLRRLLIAKHLDVLVHECSISPTKDVCLLQILRLNTQESLSIEIILAHKPIKVT